MVSQIVIPSIKTEALYYFISEFLKSDIFCWSFFRFLAKRYLHFVERLNEMYVLVCQCRI